MRLLLAVKALCPIRKSDSGDATRSCAVARPDGTRRVRDLFRLALISAAGLLAPPASSALECPTSVSVMLPDSEIAPFVYGSGPGLAAEPGLLVHWTDAAVRKTGCSTKINYLRMPALRGVRELSAGTVDIAAGVAVNDERLNLLRFPLSPHGLNKSLTIATIEVSLFARASDRIDWGPQKQLPSGTTVGVVRGQIPAIYAQQAGWPIDEANDAPANFRKLALGRVGLVAEQNLIAAGVLDAHPDWSIVRLVPAVRAENYYSPVSHAFYERFPEFSEIYWMNVCKEAHNFFTAMPPCRP